MHEGKHGILDGLEDMDDLFGLEDEEEEDKEGHEHGDCGCHKHKHEHDDT
ncbi:MAG: hypothetical protein H6Q60_285 [Oscillospiraceae bacterium]|nr:hypothetical protein [Oscillospiraceae bacterium]